MLYTCLFSFRLSGLAFGCFGWWWNVRLWRVETGAGMVGVESLQGEVRRGDEDGDELRAQTD